MLRQYCLNCIVADAMNQFPPQARAPLSLASRLLAAGRRIGALLAALLLTVASLLTFPAQIPGMIAVWLGVFTVLTLAGRRGWPALAGCVMIVIIKRVDWPPALWLFIVAIFLVGTLAWRSARRAAIAPGKSRANRPILCLAVVWLAWAGLVWDWQRSGHANHPISPLNQRPIVCIGDSLTSYPPHGGYPQMLGRLVTVPVVNLGAPGITSAEALKQLPKLSAARPQAVVIELGGHDFLKDTTWLKTESRAATKRNLEKLIAAARALHAEVVLMEVPRGFIVDPFAGPERELAREHDLELISDTAIRKLVLWSPYCPPGAWTGGPYLSDDGLHPNPRGDDYLANVVLTSLERLFGPMLRARSP